MNSVLLSRYDKGAMIEYYVSNPDTSMRQLADMFGSNEHTVTKIISRDYFGYRGKKPKTITRQSKINESEYCLITID